MSYNSTRNMQFQLLYTASYSRINKLSLTKHLLIYTYWFVFSQVQTPLNLYN